MERTQRLKYEMFVRVRNFGTTNLDVFPEATPAGQKFAQLAAVVTTIEDQLVQRARARAEARKVKIATRRSVMDYMKALASTGRQAAEEESGAHPFRLPMRRAAAEVLTTARLFMEEAERRKEKFVELGMPPTFLTDFAAVVDGLEAAIGVQQDSRGARQKAQAGIESGLERGMKLVNQLDVTVANALRTDAVRLGQWHGARHMNYPVADSGTKPPVHVVNNTTNTPAAPSTPENTQPVDVPEDVKMAS
jgi:hypothetical protein